MVRQRAPDECAIVVILWVPRKHRVGNGARKIEDGLLPRLTTAVRPPAISDLRGEINMGDRAAIDGIVTKAYAARAAKDLDAIAAIFKPDATFHMVGSPATFPAAGRAAGEAQLKAAIGSLIQTFDFLDQKMVTSVIEDNKAAVHWRIRVKHNPSGKIFETEILDIWTIDGGRVASLVQFCDTALVASVLAGN
jgi:ketosteroid isomerase-like protein